MIKFTVFGVPAQMGSKKAFVRGTRAILTDDNSVKRKQWANAVATEAATRMRGQKLMDGPVTVCVEFFFPRPKSHYGSGKNSQVLKASAPSLHSQSPDLDKLIRCLGDAMTGIVYQDDRQIYAVEARRSWTVSQARAEVEVFLDEEK